MWYISVHIASLTYLLFTNFEPQIKLCISMMQHWFRDNKEKQTNQIYFCWAEKMGNNGRYTKCSLFRLAKMGPSLKSMS